jgi:hypothetical protein
LRSCDTYEGLGRPVAQLALDAHAEIERIRRWRGLLHHALHQRARLVEPRLPVGEQRQVVRRRHALSG